MNTPVGNNYNGTLIQLGLLRNLAALSKQPGSLYYRGRYMIAGIMEKAGKLSPYAF